MLRNTMKLGFSLILAGVFLAGCASTSEQTDSQVSDASAASATDVNAATASGSGSVDTSVTQSTESAAADLDTVFYFDFDQSTLRPATLTLLSAHAAALKANPRAIRLEGHADERGTREYNIALGERRALAVRDFLRSEGVTSVIEVVSYGEERPLATGSDDASWQQNRRVELF